MSRRQEIHRKAAEAAIRDRRRLVAAIIGLVMCLAAFYALALKKQSDEADLATKQEGVSTDLADGIPQPDRAKLAGIRDSSEAEQVILEPEAFAELARLGRSLVGSWLYVMGEPAFPFDASPEEQAQLRAEPFRLRATLLDGQIIRRGVGQAEEYWCLLRTEDGHLVHYVAMSPPEELMVNQNFVLADGYYYKQYRKRIDDQWITAPLFVGRVLAPSFRKLEPISEPDSELMAQLEDHPLGTNNDPRKLDQRKELWHLMNLAQSVNAEGGVDHEDAILLDYDKLVALSKNPEVYRGRLFELGGLVREAATVRAEENPLRVREISSAWIRNESLGDTLMHLKAPGDFNFYPNKGPVIYHGYFLMLWAYVDTKSIPRRVPVFVVTDAEVQVVPTPPFAGQMAFLFIGIAVVLGLLMFFVVQRDRKRNTAAMEALVAKRAARRKEGDQKSTS